MADRVAEVRPTRVQEPAGLIFGMEAAADRGRVAEGTAARRRLATPEHRVWRNHDRVLPYLG